jgi:hypothetical protein
VALQIPIGARRMAIECHPFITLFARRQIMQPQYHLLE